VLAHWDDVAGVERRLGHLGGTWFNLGRAAGTVAAGVQRIVLPAGAWSTPAHVHGRNEEIFFVLAGSGLSWQDGETYAIGAGDCLVHHVSGRAHTLLAGDDGLDVLAFGTRSWDEAPTLTRARSVWLGEGWVVLAGDEDHPWEREAAAGAPELPPAPSPRPPTIAAAADVEPLARSRRTVARDRRDLGRAAGSVRTGLKLVALEPGELSSPHHCHSAEEEIFVVLDGTGTLELLPAPQAARYGATEEVHALARGHVVSRPAGTGVAHAFRGGDRALTFLAYGTRHPNDTCYYPRSNKIFWRGLGVIGRIESLDYDDGES
jgi:uncharacterized cupin superfamily protein